MSDQYHNTPQPAWRSVGVGHNASFICFACNKSKSTGGRRMQSVKGLRTWVCLGCVKPKK